MTAQRVPWLVPREGRTRGLSASRSNPTIPYLLPLARDSVDGGRLSTDIERVRMASIRCGVVAAMGALWWRVAAHRRMDWRIDWFAPAVGVVAFGLWIGLDSLARKRTQPQHASATAETAEPWRVAWVVFRVLDPW